MLEDVPDQYKTKEMCNRAMQKDPEVLRFVPDQLVTQEMEEFDDDELITWRDAYIKRKT